MVPAIARRAIAVFKPLFRFFLFLDNGAAQLVQAVAQLVQPLFHTQQLNTIGKPKLPIAVNNSWASTKQAHQ